MADIDRMAQNPPRYEVPTINPRYLNEHYPHNVHPVSMMPWAGSVKMLGLPTYRSISNADLVLIFDAILFDRSLLNPLFNFMSTLYLMLPRARRRGVKMGMYNVGVGPVTTDLGKRMLRTIVENMDFITVRDPGSIDVLKEADAYRDDVILAADAAVNAPYSSTERTEQILRHLGVDTSNEFIAVNINPYIDSWADRANKDLTRTVFLERYAAALIATWNDLRVPYLFVCTQHMDAAITEELKNKLDHKMVLGTFSNKGYSHQDVKAVLGRAGLTVGMRLHSLILSASMGVPVVGLQYQPKVRFFMEANGLENYTLEFRHFSASNFAEVIRRGWEDRQEIRSRLARRIPELQASAREAARLSIHLLGSQ